MFKKKTKKIHLEIDQGNLKKLSLFESVDGNFNELGYNVTYLRIPGGLIRTVINTEAIDQLFIPLPNSYFTS
ncbi:MAG: hypothetical protein IKO49_01955 [Bacilli bacterium]|nr:hypothetical protein [Clostridia bacterium]MBR4618044.1 hypothetical protein [Bacilli bacterium]